MIDETYLEALRRNFAGISESQIFMNLYHPSMTLQDESDVLPLFQVGAAIMLDKPFVLMVRPGMDIPAKLIKVADVIVVFDAEDMPGTAERMREAMATLGVTE